MCELIHKINRKKSESKNCFVKESILCDNRAECASISAVHIFHLCVGKKRIFLYYYDAMLFFAVPSSDGCLQVHRRIYSFIINEYLRCMQFDNWTKHEISAASSYTLKIQLCDQIASAVAYIHCDTVIFILKPQMLIHRYVHKHIITTLWDFHVNLYFYESVLSTVKDNYFVSTIT